MRLSQVQNYKYCIHRGAPTPRMGIQEGKYMIRKLPVFKGYTVDLRLQEFRKVPFNDLPEFVPLLSDKGARLFNEFRQTEEGRKEIAYVLGRRLDDH